MTDITEQDVAEVSEVTEAENATATTATETEKPSDPAPAFPDDWRQKIAGEDAAKLKRLDRFASPNALFDSYINLEKKLASTRSVVERPEDGASEEDFAKWRKANGIPDKAEMYLEDMPEGLIVGEDYKPLIDRYLESAHAKGISKEAAQHAVAEFIMATNAQEEQMIEADSDYRADSVNTLKEEWGGDFKRNMIAIKSLLDGYGEVGELINQGRTADGRKLGDDPRVLRVLVDMARKINPVASVVSDGKIDSLQSELNEIKRIQQNDPDRYYRDAGMQKRYGELLVAAERSR